MAETPETPDIRLLAISLMIEICPGFSALGKPGCPGFSPSTKAWISRPRAFRRVSRGSSVDCYQCTLPGGIAVRELGDRVHDPAPRGRLVIVAGGHELVGSGCA